jgi:hypothetical protein
LIWLYLSLSSNGKSNEEVKMPIVHVDFWEGVGEEKVKAMIRGITNVIMDLGVPEQAV